MDEWQQPPDSGFVGVDWGTTHRRAYAFNPEGICIRTLADNEGALACKGRFASALNTTLERLQVQPGRVLMSGMVGSALGWREVPYVDAGVALADLPHHLVRVNETAFGAVCRIVPGYCVRTARGQPDVMRGEETQLLGAWAMGYRGGWFVLPGTHSKWVELHAGRIVQLRTYMTGELFALLGQHGTISAAAGTATQVWDEAAFTQGVQSVADGALSHQLFGCRARVVCGDMLASSVRSYLSGLLIGSELHDVLRSGGEALRANPIQFIGAPELAAHYLAAADSLQLNLEMVDAQAAYLAALAYFQTHWKHA